MVKVGLVSKLVSYAQLRASLRALLGCALTESPVGQEPRSGTRAAAAGGDEPLPHSPSLRAGEVWLPAPLTAAQPAVPMSGSADPSPGAPLPFPLHPGTTALHIPWAKKGRPRRTGTCTLPCSPCRLQGQLHQPGPTGLVLTTKLQPEPQCSC